MVRPCTRVDCKRLCRPNGPSHATVSLEKNQVTNAAATDLPLIHQTATIEVPRPMMLGETSGSVETVTHYAAAGLLPMERSGEGLVVARATAEAASIPVEFRGLAHERQTPDALCSDPGTVRYLLEDTHGYLEANVSDQSDRAVGSLEHLEQELRAAVERADEPRPLSVTLQRAQTIIVAANRLATVGRRVAVTRSGNVAITFISERRYAIFECDADGDVVLTLTDRMHDGEADTYVVEPGHESKYLVQVAHFLAE